MVFGKLGTSPQDVLRRISKHAIQRKVVYNTVEQLFKSEFKGKTFLEVACGTSIECLLFSLRGANCLGVDLDPTVLSYAGKVRAIFTDNITLDLCRADGYTIPCKSQSFDLVFSQGFLEHFDKRNTARLIEEQYRLLKPGGYLLVDVPNLHSPYELYKRIYTLFGPWLYGIERGISKSELLKNCQRFGMEYVQTFRWSFLGFPYRNLFDLIYMAPLLAVRQILQVVGKGHDSIGVVLRRKD